MKVIQKKIYTTTIIADKGKKFDIGLIEKANIIDDDELKTLKMMSGGHAIRWYSTINYEEIPDSQYIEWFNATQIDTE